MAKKISLAFTILLLSLFSAQTALATQGACSYHNGVNCSAGPNYNGNVTCNDGWVNSSVLYSDTDECKVADTCPAIISGLSCTNESDYARVQKQVDDMRGNAYSLSARSGTPYYDTSIGQDKLDSCREAIKLYAGMVAAHEQCENQRASQQDLYYQHSLDAICANHFGAGSTWNEALPFDSKTTKCTQSDAATRAAQIDAIFQVNFKAAMDSLPDYQGIVDPAVIKPLTLDPKNADKTFVQIIKETYGSAVAEKLTAKNSVPPTPVKAQSVPMPQPKPQPKPSAKVQAKPVAPNPVVKTAPKLVEENKIVATTTTPQVAKPDGFLKRLWKFIWRF